MTWIGFVLLTGAAVTTARWWARRVDELGRPRSFPTFSVVLLVVVAGGAFMPGILRARLEHRLSDVASQVVGAPVEVECQSFGRALADLGAEGGYVAFGPDGTPERKTLIKRDWCKHLSSYMRSDKSAPSREQIQAVHILTHEAIHMSGVTSETHTECLAVQRNAEVARLLGATSEQAQALSRLYWIWMYPHMPDTYRSPGCGPGLQLDAGSPDAPWTEAS